MEVRVLETVIVIGIAIIGLMFLFTNIRLTSMDRKLDKLVTKEVCKAHQERLLDKIQDNAKDLNGFGKRLNLVERA